MRLKELLDYELRCSERYLRFMSVVMIICDEMKTCEHIRHLTRNSDESFMFKDAIGVLMSETDINGSLKAVERFRSGLNGQNLRFAVVSYPHDGSNATSLLATLLQRFEKAKTGLQGAIVASG